MSKITHQFAKDDKKQRARGFIGVAGLMGVLVLSGCNQPDLTPYDMKRAKEFVLSSLPALPPDRSNRYGDNPKAAALGEKLFFDTGLSITSNIACGTCHQPDRHFQDGSKTGFGIDAVKRRTMPLRGAQWGDWFFWDGRKDSQWGQALEPFETAAEHGMTRDMVGREVLSRYKDAYQEIFGDMPDVTRWPYRVSPFVAGQPTLDWEDTPTAIQEEINLVFANIGKAIASYQRTLLPLENRVDRFFSARMKGEEPGEADQLTEEELEGFKLFTGKAKCDNCHSGPLYTDQFFHNTGVPFSNPDEPDFGRSTVLAELKSDMFGCLGTYSDAKQDECPNVVFMSDDPSVFEGAFKTPSLRGVSNRPPYMNAGQIATLEAVIEHYLVRPDPFFGILDHNGKAEETGTHSELPEIELSETEKAQLLAFLKAL